MIKTRKITKEERANNICDLCKIHYEIHKAEEMFVIENYEDEMAAKYQIREFNETYSIVHAHMKNDCLRNGNNEYCVGKLDALKKFTQYDDGKEDHSLFKEE